MVMASFIRHELIEDKDGYALILYLDPNDTEFSKELGLHGGGQGSEKPRHSEKPGLSEKPRHSEKPGHSEKLDCSEKPENSEKLDRKVREYIRDNFRNIKISVVKIMAGSLLVAALHLSAPAVSYASSQVMSSQSIGFPNRIIINGVAYSFSRQPVIINGTTFVPVRGVAEVLGCEVWWDGASKTVGIIKGNTQITFMIGADHALINGRQVKMQPSYVDRGTTMVPLRFISECLGMDVKWDQSTRTVYISSQTTEYTVKSGDTLWLIANRLNTSVAELKKLNNLSSDMIYPGQKLYYRPDETNPPSVHSATTVDTVSHIPYTVVQGDSLWDISIRFGIPMHELLKVNGMTTNTQLSVGQTIMVPVHRVPVKDTLGPEYGEYLNWWTEAQYVFPIGKVATVTDFQTGKKFRIKRTIGANHADCEPLTAKDAAIIKEVWGGVYSWKERAVIIEVDGRKLAASMSSMPHDIEYIADNNFNGHFDVHFKNSTRHVDGKITAAHQEQIRRAAGV
jgi:LysM repeat protein